MGLSVVAAMTAPIQYATFNPDACDEFRASFEATQARLRERSKQLAGAASLHAVHLQWDEAGPVSDIIPRATFAVWKRTLLADKRGTA